MMRFGFLVFLLLTWAEHPTEAAPVMRRAEAQLSAGGEFRDVHDAKPSHAKYFEAFRGDDRLTGADIHSGSEADMCDIDYQLGNESTCNCSSPVHNLILQREMCLQAAIEAGRTADEKEFEVKYDYGQVHPLGCFVYNCDQDPEGKCYFFNPVGNWPHGKDANGTVDGTPICQRPKYLTGSVDENGTNSCPDGYKVINDEDYCARVADCLSYDIGEPLLIGTQNASKQGDYTRACFIDSEDGKFYFNKADAGIKRVAKPRGTPICTVKNDAAAGKPTPTAADGPPATGETEAPAVPAEAAGPAAPAEAADPATPAAPPS